MEIIFKTEGWGEWQRVSSERTPWAVKCPYHKLVYLTHAEYMRQLCAADSRWCCPDCGELAYWDDNNHQEYLDYVEEDAT